MGFCCAYFALNVYLHKYLLSCFKNCERTLRCSKERKRQRYAGPHVGWKYNPYDTVVQEWAKAEGSDLILVIPICFILCSYDIQPQLENRLFEVFTIFHSSFISSQRPAASTTIIFSMFSSWQHFILQRWKIFRQHYDHAISHSRIHIRYRNCTNSCRANQSMRNFGVIQTQQQLWQFSLYSSSTSGGVPCLVSTH